MAKDGPGGEKTEKPTPQRLKKARKEGQIPRTQELGTWLGDQEHGHGALQRALAEVLGDPSVGLVVWVPERGYYVDVDGRAVWATYHPSAAIRFGPNGAPRAGLLADLTAVAGTLA